MLFASSGFQTSSALTVREALRLCETESFALIVLGHSMPVKDRQVLMQELRNRCKAPILALHRPGEAPPSGADYIFFSMQGPELLLETIAGILKSKNQNPVRRRVVSQEDWKSQDIHAQETKKRQHIRPA
jgi:DNA-binding response OmpR family regulator